MSQEPSQRRLAEERDLRAIFAIYMHPSVVPFLGFDPMPLEGFRPIYEDLLRGRNFFVYETSGRLGGFYKAWRHPGRSHHVACIACLAVNPHLQGRGVARACGGRAGDPRGRRGVADDRALESRQPPAAHAPRQRGPSEGGRSARADAAGHALPLCG